MSLNDKLVEVKIVVLRGNSGEVEIIPDIRFKEGLKVGESKVTS